jgi:hypothetical protein
MAFLLFEDGADAAAGNRRLVAPAARFCELRHNARQIRPEAWRQDDAGRARSDVCRADPTSGRHRQSTTGPAAATSRAAPA